MLQKDTKGSWPALPAILLCAPHKSEHYSGAVDGRFWTTNPNSGQTTEKGDNLIDMGGEVESGAWAQSCCCPLNENMCYC